MNQKVNMKFHHVCIIASDYNKAIHFYVDILGLQVYRTSFSSNKSAKKIELYCNGEYVIELFVKEAVTNVELEETLSAGMEHISFFVPDVQQMILYLRKHNVLVTEVREDMITGRKYGFCFDPDGTKIEFYEMER